MAQETQGKARVARRAETQTAVAVQQAAQSLYGFDPQAVETIRNTVARGATNHELALFLYTAHKLGLDPLLRQIWFIKYAEGQPSIQVGRDGLLAIAQRDEGYETPISQAVYSKDEFELDVAEGKVRHIIRNPGDRGILLGAYCIAPHKTRRPVVTWVSYDEYAKAWGQRNPVWRTNPAEMIRKVAESQSLRRQYAHTGITVVYVQDEFGDGAEGEVVDGEALPLQATREEIDGLIARAVTAGLTVDEVKAAFTTATGRATLEGWSRDRAEFDAWTAQIDAAIAAKAEAKATTTEPASDAKKKAKKTNGKSETKAVEENLDEQLGRLEGMPHDPITDAQKQHIVELCSKLQEPGGVPLAWLRKTLGVEDITKLTQSAAQDLILHLEELVKTRVKGQQALL